MQAEGISYRSIKQIISRRTRQQKQIEPTQVSRKQIGEEIQKAEAENRSEKSEV